GGAVRPEPPGDAQVFGDLPGQKITLLKAALAGSALRVKVNPAGALEAMRLCEPGALFGGQRRSGPGRARPQPEDESGANPAPGSQSCGRANQSWWFHFIFGSDVCIPIGGC